jgi:hypothetical protein
MEGEHLLVDWPISREYGGNIFFMLWSPAEDGLLSSDVLSPTQ